MSIQKHEGGLITATRNDTENTINNRMTISRKQKWEGKQLYGRFKRLTNNISHDRTWTWLWIGGLGSWRTGGDHPNDSIIENGQNTKKSPGYLRRLAVTKTPVKNHRLTLM